MDRLEELCRAMCEADGTSSEDWLSKRHLAEAAVRRFDQWAPYLVPATYGCPECQTVVIISSPIPLGACDACGTQMVLFSA